MALSTYAELQASVAAWMRRSDLTDVIPDFIALAEAQMNSRLRVWWQEGRYIAAIGDEYSAVPDDFLGAKTFALNDPPAVNLDLLTADQMERVAQAAQTGKPAYYAVVGPEFRFYPIPAADWSAQLTYWQSIPALASAGTNWVLRLFSDAYLYGALTQAALYVRDDERAGMWAGAFNGVLDRIETASLRITMAGQLTPSSNGAVA